MLPSVEGLPEQGWSSVAGSDPVEQTALIERAFGRVLRDERGLFSFALHGFGVVAYVSFVCMPSPCGIGDPRIIGASILATDFRTLTRVKEVLMGRRASLD